MVKKFLRAKVGLMWCPCLEARVHTLTTLPWVLRVQSLVIARFLICWICRDPDCDVYVYMCICVEIASRRARTEKVTTKYLHTHSGMFIFDRRHNFLLRSRRVSLRWLLGSRNTQSLGSPSYSIHNIPDLPQQPFWAALLVPSNDRRRPQRALEFAVFLEVPGTSTTYSFVGYPC